MPNDIRGINLFGYLKTELGIGEGARIIARCLKAVGISYTLLNVDAHSTHRRNDRSFSDFAWDNPYQINLIHVNAAELPMLYREKGSGRFRKKYNIGFWFWELSEFPKEWMQSFSYCQEVWAASNFTYQAISARSPIPVFKIPLAVVVDDIKNVGRSYFGLQEDELIFLFIFDFFSYAERKNPLAIIHAFKKAFSPSEKVRLVIKYSNSSFDLRASQEMKDAAHGLKVNFIDSYLNPTYRSVFYSIVDKI